MISNRLPQLTLALAITSNLAGLSTLLVASEGHAVTVTSGLIGYWPANGNGSDLSGFGRDLTLNGGLGFATGVAGQALHFVADNTQFASRTVDDSAFDFGTGNFTLQVWASFTNFGIAEHTLFEKFTGAGGPGWTLTQLPGPHLQFYASGNAILDTSASPLPQLATNTWHNILVRRQGNAFSLFLDGRAIGSGDAAVDISTIEPLRIGNRHGPQSFPMNGRIDEAAIWGRALTDAEVATQYQEFADTPPLPPPASPPFIWVRSAGGNGHAYEFVRANAITWEGARDAAGKRTFGGVAGHLATATSAAENQFLQTVMIDAETRQVINPFIEAWLGASQQSFSSPAHESWAWVTGEPWNFTNWDSDEPNDSSGDERYLGIWGPGGDGPRGAWNDQGGPNDPFAAGNIQGYLVEYPVPEPSRWLPIGQAAIIAFAYRRLKLGTT